MSGDPERERIGALLKRERAGGSDAPLREELALYRAEKPELVEDVARSLDDDKQWLARVEADKQLKRREATPWVKAERGLGVGLVAAGFILGPAATLSGLALLVWSFGRARLRTFRQDPYTEIEE